MKTRCFGSCPTLPNSNPRPMHRERTSYIICRAQPKMKIHKLLVQKLRWQQSIKPSTSPSKWQALCDCPSYTPWSCAWIKRCIYKYTLKKCTSLQSNTQYTWILAHQHRSMGKWQRTKKIEPGVRRPLATHKSLNTSRL